MSELPLVSIIIPVYNHAITLFRSIETLFTQNYRPLEIIIVNDGSTDNFSEIEEKITSFSSENFKIQITTQPHRGAPAARNYGFRLSQGKYILFWDADTMGHTDMIQKMYQVLSEHPEVGYAYSQFYFGGKLFSSRPFEAEYLKKENFIITMSLLRRDLFPGFDESLRRFQDWDLWLTLLGQGVTGIFIPEVLFEVVTEGRKGMSNWIPKIFYKLPWKIPAVRRYEEAKNIVIKKHGL